MYICSERNKAKILTGLLVLTDTIKLLTDIEHKQEINNSMHMLSFFRYGYRQIYTLLKFDLVEVHCCVSN